MSADSYARIYAVVRRIPRGKVATYGQVASLAGLPHAPRVAGYALHALPDGSPIPWHRVVAAGGRLSLGRLSPHGAITQRLRLEKEGVRFDARGCADMEHGRWRAGLDPEPKPARRRPKPRTR
jgi:methylated-DNA-protein-cysteine methyltransferase-like protein